MTQLSTLVILILLLTPGAGTASSQEARNVKNEGVVAQKGKVLTKEERIALIRKAQVWIPTAVPAMNMRTGPRGPDSFPPDTLVTCDFAGTNLSGSSRKFECQIRENDVVKVRYGGANGEVEGSLLASRLLWALGFGADRVYPVRILCRGCSLDPWSDSGKTSGEQLFDPAVIERKPEGVEIKTEKDEGWGWDELALSDEVLGGATRAQRDALTLLAIFMQHTDSKPEQQRIWCLPGGMSEEGLCQKPFLLLHDVGLTFGHANFANRAETASVNFEQWSSTPVWRDAQSCIGHMSKSGTGTLGDPKISEAGRSFLSNLLGQLTHQQLRDLFDVARVRRRSRNPEDVQLAVSAKVEEWVAVFKHKRDEIATARCPS